MYEVLVEPTYKNKTVPLYSNHAGHRRKVRGVSAPSKTQS